jgi:hypothetical protein
MIVRELLRVNECIVWGIAAFVTEGQSLHQKNILQLRAAVVKFLQG